MKHSGIVLTIVALTIVVVAAAPANAGEWVKLFNGKNLDGWVQLGGKALYEVKDGVLEGSSVPNTENTFLCPKKKYADFELTFEVQCDPELNSGVQIRSYNNIKDVPEGLTEDNIERAKRRFTTKNLCGPQVEIAAGGGAGGVYFEGIGGWLLAPKKEIAKDAYKAEGWNAYRVLAKGANVKVWINDTLINDGDISKGGVAAGYLGFQVHGVGKKTETVRVRWRNIKIRDLK